MPSSSTRSTASSAFKRIAFLQPETPQAEVEEHFAELIYRWTTLKSLDREVQDQALDLAELSEADFEHFAELAAARLPMPGSAMPPTTRATATAPSGSTIPSPG